MANIGFLPRVLPDEGEIDMEDTDSAYASRTYGLDWEAGRIKGFVDGLDSLCQAVNKMIRTAAGVYPIYGETYGFFYQDLIGVDMDIAKSEIRRRLEASLLADNRVAGLEDFQFAEESSVLRISFIVRGETGEEAAIEGRIEGLS